jgi:hypothetical protein
MATFDCFYFELLPSSLDYNLLTLGPLNLEFEYVFNVGAIWEAISPCLARQSPTSLDHTLLTRFFPSPPTLSYPPDATPHHTGIVSLPIPGLIASRNPARLVGPTFPPSLQDPRDHPPMPCAP